MLLNDLFNYHRDFVRPHPVRPAGGFSAEFVVIEDDKEIGSVFFCRSMIRDARGAGTVYHHQIKDDNRHADDEYHPPEQVPVFLFHTMVLQALILEFCDTYGNAIRGFAKAKGFQEGSAGSIPHHRLQTIPNYYGSNAYQYILFLAYH